MRYLLAVALAFAPAVTAAQWGRPTPTTSDPPPAVGALPPIGLPLAPIGLPLAPLGVAAGETPTQSPSSSPARPRRLERGNRSRSPRGGSRGGAVYVVPYFWSGPAAAMFGASSPAATPTPAAPAAVATATLWLEVNPRGAVEIYVNGDFIGTADERNPVVLEPGRHRVELRAAGHETQSVDLRADPGASLTLRRTLEPLPAAAPAPPDPTPAPPAVPVARKPFYFIPGCYLGDVPPKDAGLPASCDHSKTVVMRP